MNSTIEIKSNVISNPDIKYESATQKNRWKNTAEIVGLVALGILTIVGGMLIDSGMILPDNAVVASAALIISSTITGYLVARFIGQKRYVGFRVFKEARTSFPDNDRPNMLILTAEKDFNGAFKVDQRKLYSKLEQKYNLVFKTISKISDIENQLKEAALTKKITALWINAHGTPNGIVLDQSNSLRIEDLKSLAPVLKSTMSSEGTIVLDACSTAKKSSELSYSFASILSILSGREVIAAKRKTYRRLISSLEPLDVRLLARSKSQMAFFRSFDKFLHLLSFIPRPLADCAICLHPREEFEKVKKINEVVKAALDVHSVLQPANPVVALDNTLHKGAEQPQKERINLILSSKQLPIDANQKQDFSKENITIIETVSTITDVKSALKKHSPIKVLWLKASSSLKGLLLDQNNGNHLGLKELTKNADIGKLLHDSLDENGGILIEPSLDKTVKAFHRSFVSILSVVSKRFVLVPEPVIENLFSRIFSLMSSFFNRTESKIFNLILPEDELEQINQKKVFLESIITEISAEAATSQNYFADKVSEDCPNLA